MKTKYLKYIFEKIFGFISAKNSNLTRKIKKYN